MWVRYISSLPGTDWDHSPFQELYCVASTHTHTLTHTHTHKSPPSLTQWNFHSKSTNCLCTWKQVSFKSTRPEGHSPGDFVAVHSLAVSGENTLKGQNQHFVQGCMETVKRREAKKTRDIGRKFIIKQTRNCTASHFIKTFHSNNTPGITALLCFGCCWEKMFSIGVYVLRTDNWYPQGLQILCSFTLHLVCSGARQRWV